MDASFGENVTLLARKMQLATAPYEILLVEIAFGN